MGINRNGENYLRFADIIFLISLDELLGCSENNADF